LKDLAKVIDFDEESGKIQHFGFLAGEN